MVRSSGSWRRLTAVTAEGVASGTPLMVGSKLLQGWLTASGVNLGLLKRLAVGICSFFLKLTDAQHY